MLMDSKGKLFGKISVVDAIVLVVIITLALGTFYKFGVLEKSSGAASMSKISYTVKVKRVRPFILDCIKEGDVLFDKTSGNSIGTIVKIDSYDATDSLSDLSGKYSTVNVQNRIDVVLHVEADAARNANGSHYVGRTYELIRNSTKKFMTKYYEFNGSVKDIGTDAAANGSISSPIPDEEEGQPPASNLNDSNTDPGAEQE